MYKIIPILYMALAITNGEVLNETYTDILETYDMQIKMFRQPFNAGLNVINMQLDLLINSLTQMEEFLNRFQSLNSVNQECVSRYRSSLPTQNAVMSSIGGCISSAKAGLNQTLNLLLATRNSLADNFYVFQNQMKNCARNYGANSNNLNYTTCITKVNEAAKSYIISNQHTFHDQMSMARSQVDINAKYAINCSFVYLDNTIFTMSKVDTLINSCANEINCVKCTMDYSCPNIDYINSSEVNPFNNTMQNPFYGRTDITNCLMLKIIA